MIGNNQLADLGIAQQLRQQAHEHHRGRNFAALGAFVELFEVSVRNRRERRGADFALGHVAAQLLAAFLHVA